MSLANLAIYILAICIMANSLRKQLIFAVQFSDTLNIHRITVCEYQGSPFQISECGMHMDKHLQ